MQVFAPYHPLALLAAPLPPDPPPMTIKSYCFVTRTILTVAEENFLARLEETRAEMESFTHKLSAAVTLVEPESSSG